MSLQMNSEKSPLTRRASTIAQNQQTIAIVPNYRHHLKERNHRLDHHNQLSRLDVVAKGKAYQLIDANLLTTDREILLRVQQNNQFNHQQNRLVKLNPEGLLTRKRATTKMQQPQARPNQSNRPIRRAPKRQQENVSQAYLMISNNINNNSNTTKISQPMKLASNPKLNQSQSFLHQHQHYLRKLNQVSEVQRLNHQMKTVLPSLKRAASPVNFHLRNGKRTRG